MNNTLLITTTKDIKRIFSGLHAKDKHSWCANNHVLMIKHLQLFKPIIRWSNVNLNNKCYVKLTTCVSFLYGLKKSGSMSITPSSCAICNIQLQNAVIHSDREVPAAHITTSIQLYYTLTNNFPLKQTALLLTVCDWKCTECSDKNNTFDYGHNLC